MHGARSGRLTWGAPWDLPSTDVMDGVHRAQNDLLRLKGARLLVTGGTGFLGSWLVASLLAANHEFGLGLRLVVLTRNPGSTDLPRDKTVELLEGDVRALPDIGSVDFIVHGAAASSAAFGIGEGHPRQVTDTIVDGTRQVLELAARSCARVLFLSSGAVYGPQIGPVVEQDRTAPDPLEVRSAYGLAKRLAENLCVVATDQRQAEVVVARLFAFVGPRIPISAHFAAGNFLGDALANRAILVKGDGRDVRSYLYAGDLPEWCWALLARGSPGLAYNVGSPVAVNIAELAQLVASLPTPQLPVTIVERAGTQPASWYVPSTSLAEIQLGLRPRTSLEQGFQMTYDWLRGRQ